MLRSSGRELRRVWRRHSKSVRGFICGCPECDGVVVPLGSSRSAEKREWMRDLEAEAKSEDAEYEYFLKRAIANQIASELVEDGDGG